MKLYFRLSQISKKGRKGKKESKRQIMNSLLFCCVSTSISFVCGCVVFVKEGFTITSTSVKFIRRMKLSIEI